MRAIQITEPGRFRIVDTPEPAAGPGEVLIAVQACVTCPHWDTTIFRGVDIFDRPGHPKYPIPVGYPGHEVSGRVEAVGEGVTSLQVGDRVATLKAGGESNPGFYSELISRPAEMVTRIPDNTSYEAAASMEMAYHMSPYVRALGDVAGKRVGIVGLGPAGIIALQMVRAEGAGAVVAIDLVPERLELAARWARTRWSASSRARRPRSWNGSRCRPASTAPARRRACRWRWTTPSTDRCRRSG